MNYSITRDEPTRNAYLKSELRNILTALAATAQARIGAEPDTDLYIDGYRHGHEDALRCVALAWIEAHGTRGSYAGVLNGDAGVFVPERGEFWPLAACEAQLAGYLPIAE
jgi:hypothetical protein